MTAMTTTPTVTARQRARSRVGEAGAEVALALVSLATVAGFARLYHGFSFFWPLATFVVAGHGLAVFCRRRGVGAFPTALIAVGAGAVLVGWLLFPHTTAFGLPTPTTWTRAHRALDQAANRFGTVVAPAPVLPGFQLAAALALWGAVWFADWSAFRIRATAESVAPCAVLFLFGALLGSPQHRTWTTAAFVAAVLLFVLSHRTSRQDQGRTWVASSAAGGRRSILQAGAVVALVAVLGGAALGPHVPGAASRPLVGWRQTQTGPSSRITVSPLVDIRRRLVEQSDTVAFDVRTSQRAYWRLTSLDAFDGRIWSSSGEFGRTSTQLPRSGLAPPTARRIVQDVQIRDLAAIWVPSAFEARQVDSTTPMRWDPDSSTLIVDNDRSTSDGLQYRVVSAAPVFTAGQLQLDRSVPSRAIQSAYLRLPGDLPAEVRTTAVDVTKQAPTGFDKAIALQQWFRTQFTYDLSVPPGHGENAITAFLADRRGYCEQFAGTYAAMARSLGLPSRVAVGFTTGDPDATIPGLYHVKGKHAHAWPEVYFAGLGWVPFEPTPGRGAPGAEAWTGVAEQQDAPAVPGTTVPVTTAGASQIPGRPGQASPDKGRVRSGNQPATSPTPTPGPSAAPRVLLGLGIAAGAVAVGWLLMVLLLPTWRRRRRHAAARTGAAKVRLAWDESVEPVEWISATRPWSWESDAEYAARVADQVGPLSGAHSELAQLAAAAAWADREPPEAAVARANDIARTLRHTLGDRLTRRQ
ncbi:MAG: hypothetical protein JWN46_3044, partial [Acidimicrobiales bacterium]|nr:hypothetical protein [Acidimicrobiales bacterium]